MALAGFGLLAAGSGTPAAAAPDEVAEQPIGTTRLISRGFDGKPAEGTSASASVSDDGRYVAFHSRATDIVPSPTCDPELGCNYLHDRVTGETVLVSISPTGEAPNGRVDYYPSISGDGRYVAYASGAKNLVPDDDNRKADIFVYDRLTATTTLATRNPAGDPADDHSNTGVLSQDGRYVIYQSHAKDLVPGHRGRSWDVFRTDLTTGTTILVSQKPNGKPPRGESTPSDLSADGRILVYRSGASDIAPGDDNDHWDVFAYDTQTAMTEVVSRASDGSVPDGTSWGGSISDDGRFITFSSEASDVVPPDTGVYGDVFRLDRVTGEMLLLTRNADGEPANGWSSQPTINADGTVIAFHSDATDLVSGDAAGFSDVFVIDLTDETITLLTWGRHETSADGDSEYPFISGDGNVVAYQSEATNLVRGDRNEANDVFAYRRR